MSKQKIVYKTAKQWAKYINDWLKEKGVKLTPQNVHSLFSEYGVEPTMFRNNGQYLVKDKKGRIPCYSSASFFLKCYNHDFLDKCISLCRDNEDEIINDINYDLTYRNDENDMEKHSQHLEKMYQTEDKKNFKTIIISEEALRKIVENFEDEGFATRIGE